MLKIKISSQFKKDLKKFKHNQSAINELDKVLKILVQRKDLPEKYQNHSLSGNWSSTKECHVKPDFLLIYQINEKEGLLILERLGSHSELFK